MSTPPKKPECDRSKLTPESISNQKKRLEGLYKPILKLHPGVGKYAAISSKLDTQAKHKGLLLLFCAGDTENAKQPTFYVEP